MNTPQPTLVIGVDGCPSGWIGVVRHLGQKATNAPTHSVIMFDTFKDILSHSDDFKSIAIDMPIGLPATISGPGRGPEQAVRPHLGKRRSSVFSIPSRPAVEEADYHNACNIALATSDPPRKISKQGFNLFPKILEIDREMTPALETRVYEVHPELAFWRLNGEHPLAEPKKLKGRHHPPGFDERAALLEAVGFSRDFLVQKPPKGAAVDDFLDACVCAVMAERALSGNLEPFPQNYQRDEKGLRIAIWA